LETREAGVRLGYSSATRFVVGVMISFGAASNKNKDPDKEARLAGIRQISDWVENELPEDEQETTSVMVNQIECAEEGCPPVECVIALLRKPKLVFKVRCRPNCVSRRCSRPNPPSRR
jgi:hypothetical protein